MVCLSLEHQNAEDVEHALCIGNKCDKPPSIKNYNLYFTYYGVYRGVSRPTEKLQITNTDASVVQVPWNKGRNRTFIQWTSPQWSRWSDELLAPLVIVPVQEKSFQVSKGSKLMVVTQGVHDSARTDIILLYEGQLPLDARYLCE